ncbi:MAG: hypothetical protein IJT80_07385 [Lachnospiraceae bacterium]|nr:hypothetical protein [Lachnospiraceae bacterium]
MDNGLKANEKKRIWFAGIYYILAVLLYVFNMFIEAVRPGLFATVFMFGVLAELIIRKRLTFKEFADRLVAAYFLYNALSVIWLLKGGLPVSVYEQEFIVSLLPVIFYFVGRSCNKNENERFLKNFIYAVLILGILGIALQIAMPQFYIDYSYKLSFVSKADAETCRVRMDSVVGSTVLGFISVAAMLTSIPFIMAGSAEDNKNEEQTGKDETEYRRLRIFGISALLINMIVAFMSNQRSAMVVAILVLIYINYLLFFVYRLIDKKYFIAELIVVALIFTGLCIVSMDTVMKIYYRLVSLPDAVGERSEQWVAAVNNMYSTWLGNGLGANGHRALGIEGTHVIADGGLVKMYCEQGVFGFSMFIYLVILSFKKGIKEIKEYCVELGIIAVSILSSVGSNILAFQLTTPIFWYAVGRIFADSPKEDKGSLKDEGNV